MKKAKFFLTALSVLASVGGAVAFKAKGIGTFAYCDTALQRPLCTSLSFITFATTENGEIPADYDVYGHPCLLINGHYTCTTLTRVTL